MFLGMAFLLHFTATAKMPILDATMLLKGDIEAPGRIRQVELNDPICSFCHFTISERVGIPFYPSGTSINVENLKALKLFSAIQW